MKAISEQYQETVLKAMAYIKNNLSAPISIPTLAEKLGVSSRHLLRAFRNVLNQSVVDCIRTERIGRAKSLLQQTRLSITAIAFESGFESSAFFSRTFRKKVGTTPLDFRKQVHRINETPVFAFETVPEKKEEWFKDFFHVKDIGPHWKPIYGNWRIDRACLIGTDAICAISLLKPLPENCGISFQAKTRPRPGLGGSNIFIQIMDETRSQAYYGFAIATGLGATGHLTHFRDGNQWSAEARIDADEWHNITVEIKEETLTLFIDEKKAVSFRDAFPPAYSRRCYVNIGTYHCGIDIREFFIHNLGFSPAIRPIRQGDVLYNSGMAEKAMEFYMRYLQAGSITDQETMELRYKIGMCYLKTGACLQAKAWMDKVVALQENKFWAQHARLSQLEIYWRSGDIGGLLEHMRGCLEDTATQTQARVILQSAVYDFWARGHYMESDRLLKTWLTMEPPNGLSRNGTAALLAENHQHMRRMDEAEELLRDLASRTESGDSALAARINRMQLYHEWGKIRASENLRKEIEKTTTDQSALVRCMVQQALNLRARERFAQAVETLEKIPSQYAEAEQHFLSHSKIHSAFIYCCMGHLEQGKKALEEACAVQPGLRLHSRHYLPFFLSEKNYAAAAESLRADYGSAKELVSAAAELGIKAGILHELAGMDAEAKSIFKEVSLRFPNEQVRFFGSMSHALFTGENFDFTEMPYEAHRRSEMFYLLGLLMEKRGDKEEARRFFELSVKEDPALRWPAYFAKQKLRVVHH